VADGEGRDEQGVRDCSNRCDELTHFDSDICRSPTPSILSCIAFLLNISKFFVLSTCIGMARGRILSHDFMRLPSKRQYPDYYQQIKRPIALDEIKAQLDAGAYTSFEDVKQDFETCFRNAKRYNIRESQIWKDAKHLHKLATKEYSKMTGISEDAGDAGEDGDDHGSDADGGKKKKPSNMNRLLKTRLQKLVEKTDDSGRVLSTEFMDLPNRKQWPIYYKTIKRPQCLENIFKHLKRKEYHTSLEFANDVELVFSNALEFNQDHTEIWEDAMILRDYFRQLMSDLPPPYSVPAYSGGDSPGKIKFKVPVAGSGQPHASQTSAPIISSPPNTTMSSGTLRIPPQHVANGNTSQSTIKPEASKSPVVNYPKLPTATMTAMSPRMQVAEASAPAVTPTSVPAVAHVRSPAAASAVNALQPPSYNQPPYTTSYPQHYPNAAYQQQSPPPVAAAGPSNATAHHTATMSPPTVSSGSASASQSLAPSSLSNHQQLKRVTLITKPLGRRLDLDSSHGVRTWAMRLSGETGVQVSGVEVHSYSEEYEESSEDEDMARAAREEEEEEEEEEPKAKRGRGRPRKKQKAAEPVKPIEILKSKSKGKAPSRPVHLPEDLQLKLNGVPVKPLDESKGEWNIELPVGLAVVELSAKGGMPWRLYFDRVGS